MIYKKLTIYVKSVATLGRKGSSRIFKYNPHDFKAIIIDEAHHAVTPSCQQILNHFSVFDQNSHIILWGCSATLQRNDNMALNPTFKKVVYWKTINELINERYLCKIITKTASAALNLPSSKIIENSQFPQHDKFSKNSFELYKNNINDCEFYKDNELYDISRFKNECKDYTAEELSMSMDKPKIVKFIVANYIKLAGNF